jgi:hypothetical protein
MIQQTEQLPPEYNAQERERKIEQEHQLVDMEKKLVHLIDLNEQQTKLMESYSVRTGRIEDVLFGKDYLNGMVQQVAALTRFKLWMLCTASALSSSVLTILVAYVVKRI